MSSFRRHVGVKVVLVFVLLATFAGCATPTKKGLGNGDAVAEGTVKKTGEVVDALKKLENLVKALEALIVTDAEATTAWVSDEQKAGRLTPLKAELALACPTRVLAVKDDLNRHLADLRAKFEALHAHLKDLATKGDTLEDRINAFFRTAAESGQIPDTTKGPQLILHLTKLKYGSGSGVRTQIEALRDAVAVEMDALVSGCAHLVPLKQINEIAQLLAKAGIIGAAPELAPLGVLLGG